MGAKVLNENIYGYSMKVVEKLGSKTFFKRQFLESSPYIFCEQCYKLHVILITSAMLINNYGSCV